VAQLGINIGVFISQLISFLILFGLLIILGYKPMLKMLDERSKRIKESLEQAEAAKEQSLHAEDEVKKQIQEANKKGQELITQAMKTSDDIRAQAQGLAKKDADAIIERAQQAIKTERDAALDDLRREFSDLTILAASKVIGESLDKESHKKLIDKVLKENQTINRG
jgi:F-type H+-transporting ATPase subunit b